jgi:hypothetical protein
LFGILDLRTGSLTCKTLSSCNNNMPKWGHAPLNEGEFYGHYDIHLCRIHTPL